MVIPHENHVDNVKNPLHDRGRRQEAFPSLYIAIGVAGVIIHNRHITTQLSKLHTSGAQLFRRICSLFPVLSLKIWDPRKAWDFNKVKNVTILIDQWIVAAQSIKEY